MLMAVMLAPVMVAKKADDASKIYKKDVTVGQAGNLCTVSMQIVLDSLKIGSNNQFYVTPVLSTPDKAHREVLPTILVSGRNMHYVYMRNGNKPLQETDYTIKQEVWRKNGTAQSVSYTESVPMQAWMRRLDANIALVVDTCGCGIVKGTGMDDPLPLDLNFARHMRLTYKTPIVTEGKVFKHEGRARVQFEVNRIELHEEVYRCKSGQIIDNRAQLKVIDDSIQYALSDPNVEISSINICGYASPETTYERNTYLATNRSKALAEYVSRKYSLPQERCTHSAVPENWGEFREMVVASTELTEDQRRALLELIDRPTYGPADFDQKETELKTDVRFKDVYRNMILPEWFPLLRCTQFTINTMLKPMNDEQLCELIKTKPEMLDLNQIFRVAKCYEEGSPEFHNAMEVALKFYGNDETANLNAAVEALHNEDFARAEELLAKAGNSPEAENARGVLCVHRDQLDAALEHFNAAGALPEAVKNKAYIK